MENIQVDTTINEVLVSQGAESLTVEWSTGDHHSCGPLPSQAHASIVTVERHRQGAAWTEPDFVCRSQ